jgi:hypothetical protein
MVFRYVPRGVDRATPPSGTLINADLSMAVLVAIVHATAMIVAGGFLACLVYRYFGLKFVSRSWFNLDTSWAMCLIVVGQSRWCSVSRTRGGLIS